METVDPAAPAGADPEAAGPRRLAAASLGCAAAAIVAIGWATATRNHAFWAFAVWVGLTVAAVATGVVALVRLPRRREMRPLRRLATLGVVGGVLCATLGLAVYSASRTDDCPLERQCTIPQSGPGQRSQQP
jgi:peptidoglycan/LPS O-acetylase OafA/YrhL